MRAWISCVAVAGAMLAAPAFADAGYLSIKGVKTGDIKGEVTAKGKEGQLEVVDFEYGTSTPVSATGQPSGRRLQAPVKFTLRWSKATPLLFNAAYTNETLSEVRFRHWVPQTAAGTGVGTTKMADEIWITNARVVAIKIVDRNGDKDDLEPLVEVELAYQKLSITYTDGGIAAEENWAPN